ncbi:MAG TPA: hypothetical protein VGR37_03500 [Longimicrobiaceae bacterium]|nr:hypothetical protein [Longimicrobiaceae bacterium]
MTQTVLLTVDDQEGNLVIFSAILTHRGYGVLLAVEACLERAADGEPWVELAALDEAPPRWRSDGAGRLAASLRGSPGSIAAGKSGRSWMGAAPCGRPVPQSNNRAIRMQKIYASAARHR